MKQSKSIDVIQLCQTVVKAFLNLTREDLAPILEGSQKLHLPFFSFFEIRIILEAVKDLFSKEANIIEINEPLYVIGDLHGNLFDVFRSFVNFGPIGTETYLFLGDLVDRGSFSLEVSLLIFSLKVLYPQKIFLIRGNHEFFNTSKSGGFKDELAELYTTEPVFNKFNEVWEWIPFGAKIFSNIIALHGGPCPELEHIESIQNYLSRPLDTYVQNPLCGFFWSDPDTNIDFFERSFRGTGFAFGEKALLDFLEKNNFKLLIRGHENVPKGYDWKFHGKLLTVFSASNYCGTRNNQGAIAKILNENEIQMFILPPLPNVIRSNCTYYTPKFSKEELIKPFSKKPSQVLKINASNHLPKIELPSSTKTKARHRCLENLIFTIDPFCEKNSQ